MRNNDHFGVGFDTFYDRRSGFMFYANPLGGFADYSVVDEGAPNTDWNPVWDVRTGRFEGGWTLEMQIPFKSLRYTSGPDQVWGIQFRRSIRHKNEWTYWTPVPQNMAGPQALNRVSAYGTVVGLDLPPAGRNLEIKPYALGKMTTDRLDEPADDERPRRRGRRRPEVRRHRQPHRRPDGEHRLRAGRDRRAAGQPDALQPVPAREARVLPRRPRPVRLRRAAARLAARRRPGGGFGGVDRRPYMFYSRRIGLNRGRVVPIDVGGRLTGRSARYGIGVMNIQAGDESVSASPATNFTVLRVKRDILRRSTIGAMFTNRNQSIVTAGGSNQAFGVDAAFGFYQNVALGGYYARTETTGLHGDNESYQGKFDWVPDRYGVRAEVLKVGKAFNPEVGFLRRTDFTRSFASARFSPRPKAMRAVRKFTYEGLFEYFENGAGEVESRQQTGRFNVEFDNSDMFNVEANANYDLLLMPFSPAPGVRFRRRLSLQRPADVLQHGPAAPAVGQYRPAGGRVLRRHDPGGVVLAGPLLDPQAVLGRAARVDQPGRAANGELHDAAVWRPHRLRLLAAHVRERAVAIQLRRSHLQQQRPLPLGISAGQRVLRGLDRRAGHPPARAHERLAEEPRLCGQDDAAVPFV